MSTTDKVMSTEEMEGIMASIEAEERPVAITSAIPGAAVVTDAMPAATSDSPLALREYVNPTQLKKDVEFNPNDLDNEVMRHASMFVHYANLARLARRQFERMKAACEVMESRLDAHWRAKLMEDLGKKASEGQIEAAIKGDARWWAAQNRLIDAKAIYEFANDAREAFMQRKDMIVQISVDRRRERDGELRIKEAGAIEEGRRRMMERAAAAGQSAVEAKAAVAA